MRAIDSGGCGHRHPELCIYKNRFPRGFESICNALKPATARGAEQLLFLVSWRAHGNYAVVPTESGTR
jgi:hypothetical protein